MLHYRLFFPPITAPQRLACSTSRDNPPPCGTAAATRTDPRGQRLGVEGAPERGGNASMAGESPWRPYRQNKPTINASNTGSLLLSPRPQAY